MNSLFGERATAELVGKLRLLTGCELCKKPCTETYFAVECSHYTCKNCVRPARVSIILQPGKESSNDLPKVGVDCCSPDLMLRKCILPQDGCAKCNVPGTVLRAHYLDPISETLLRLKGLLSGEPLPKPAARKRKAEQDMT